jgi:hypothetical protein
MSLAHLDAEASGEFWVSLKLEEKGRDLLLNQLSLPGDETPDI